jgi:hypothetical protein
MRPSHVYQFLKIAIEKNFPILLKSAPGCAKTSLVEQACGDLSVDLIIAHPVVSESVDFKGMPWIYQDPNLGRPVALFVPFNQLEQLINAKKRTVFFLDDLGQAVTTVQAACMQLILARALNEHKISEEVVFFAATNRKQDKAGVQGILEPVKSRFHTIIEVDVNTDDWIEWAYKNNMPSGLIQYIRWRKGPALYNFQPTLDITNSPCPRTVTKVGEMINGGIPNALRSEVFKGACGEAWGAEFTGFLKIMESLPEIDTILKEPDKAIVPPKEKADVIYAICGALIERATKDNFKNIVAYSERLPVEYSLMIVKDCILRNKSLASTPVWQKWIRAHADVLA